MHDTKKLSGISCCLMRILVIFVCAVVKMQCVLLWERGEELSQHAHVGGSLTSSSDVRGLRSNPFPCFMVDGETFGVVVMLSLLCSSRHTLLLGEPLGAVYDFGERVGKYPPPATHSSSHT